MINQLLRKIFGTRNDRLLKQANKEVLSINALEPEIKKLSDDKLKAKTDEFKSRFAKGESLDSLLPEAFAVVREASVRVLGMRHFDVQLIGGLALHQGKISEMKTGEGKTLVATLPAYLNALTGRGVHVITVNDYLAQRDRDWMAPVYEFLGMTSGVNIAEMSTEQKKEAYNCDITYGTNNEFGFDYLRDNMAFALEERVQRDLSYAIIDEVDSILIDEARTPLIISGPTEENSDRYELVNAMVPKLKVAKEVDGEVGEGDFTLDEKNHQAHLTEAGHEHVEKLFEEAGLLKGTSLYDPSNIVLMHFLSAAIRAHHLYRKDVEYVVKNGEVIIVDEHTGRLMQGRRWSDGLHQAVEAKEGVKIQCENQTLASITFQNYFRLYEKLAGMTGTADTEAYEFQQIYDLEVMVIPTNRPLARIDSADLVYLTQQDKYKAIIKEVEERRNNKQPILVGTASIESSELLSKLLKQAKIPHQVLNAKNHGKEAHIIAQAGRPGAVTIATNMAGRGTDIVLGGNLKEELAEISQDDKAKVEEITKDWQQRHKDVLKAGGLHIIGTERHESRRIDNQLRGRSGRQGDVGSSRFYLSLDDHLLRIFASDRVINMLRRLGMENDVALESKIVTRSIENAQRKVEGHNFDIRKQLLKYDDVADDQRKVIYKQRLELMKTDDIRDTIQAITDDVLNNVIDQYIPPLSLEEQWDISGAEKSLENDFGLQLPIQQWLNEESNLHEESLRERIIEKLNEHRKNQEEIISSSVMRQVEKTVMLQTLDSNWKEHLAAMDHLRQSIHLRGYAQKDPANEYKRESFKMFSEMLDNMKFETIQILSRLHLQAEEDAEVMEAERRKMAANQSKHFVHNEVNALAGDEEEPQEEQQESANTTFIREAPKVGRNEPCPCGSGKKYKQCHGKI